MGAGMRHVVAIGVLAAVLGGCAMMLAALVFYPRVFAFTLVTGVLSLLFAGVYGCCWAIAGDLIKWWRS